MKKYGLISQQNKQYEHYAQFQKAIELAPSETLMMINKHGSSDIKISPYITKCNQMMISSALHSVTKMAGSCLLILGCTFLLHRRRQWVLTAPRGIRPVAFKYLPVVLSIFVYDSIYVTRVPTNQIEMDFGEIQSQFWEIYINNGNQIQKIVQIKSK